MSKQCIICCEDSRRFVSCNYCEYTTCYSCCKRYLLESFKDASCMNCKKAWPHKFMITNLNKTFITTEYKKHREDILFDRELSMMPLTQPYIERENHMKELQIEMDGIMSIYKKLRNEYLALSHTSYKADDKPDTLSYVTRCCSETCNGFVGKDYKCGICNTKMCPKCHIILLEGHECDPTLVETVELILKDTKSCPKCFKPITKNGGCSQICCTECHCVFDWKTGEITTDLNHIHNPYYYQWLNTLGEQGIVNEYGDNINECTMNLPLYTTVVNIVKKHNESDKTYINESHRLLQHIRHVEIYRNNNNRDAFIENLDIRKKFLKNEIEKDKFKFLIQKREKAFKKKTDINAIYSLIEETGRELMHKFVRDKDFKQFHKNFTKIIDYCNTGFLDTQMQFGGIVPFIDNKTLKISTV